MSNLNMQKLLKSYRINNKDFVANSLNSILMKGKTIKNMRYKGTVDKQIANLIFFYVTNVKEDMICILTTCQ